MKLDSNGEASLVADEPSWDEAPLPLVIAMMHREGGSAVISGVETHVRQVRRYLAERGTDSALLTPFSLARPLTYPVFGPRRLIQSVCRPAGAFWYVHWHEVFLRNALRRHLAGTGACVVYAQDPFSARAALRARRGPHQHVILAWHTPAGSAADVSVADKHLSRDGALFRMIRRVECEALLQADRVVYVSRFARDAVWEWLPAAATVPHAVIGNFVTALPARPGVEPLGDLVTVGRLVPSKNHRFLLAVLAEAKRAGRTLNLDVFGEGPCRKDLVQQARDLGLKEQVRFHGSRTDVRDFLPGYRAYVHSSHAESLPLAIIEAMAAGLPVIAGDIGGISELCDDGVEARFWPLDDPAHAAILLMSLLDCEPARLAAGRAARERFHRDYDADVVGPELHSFLLGRTSNPGLPCPGSPREQPVDRRFPR